LSIAKTKLFFFEIVLDKMGELCYNLKCQGVPRQGTAGCPNKNKKKFEKPLDKLKFICYNVGTTNERN
jgi:hypothetical protein